MSQTVQRKLAAIVAVDVVGYARLIGADETGTISAFRNLRSEVIDPLIDEHGGRIVKIMGDGLLLEFHSVIAATDFAIATQERNVRRNSGVLAGTVMRLRIGVHIGDVVIDGEDILGDGVNIAARIEPLAKPDGVSLSDDAYKQVRDRLNIAWEDGGKHAAKNIARPLQVWHWVNVGQQAIERPKANTAKPELSDRPSIAILPFQNRSADPDQTYFTDGITDDIITELARYRELIVIGRQSSFAYRDALTTPTVIASELGVQYILEGSVRRSGGRIRVAVQLIDPSTGAHLWVERYDREIEDIFEVQDEITAMIVNTLTGEILRDGYQRTLVKSFDSVNAYDHFLRASEINWRGGKDDVKLARSEAMKAITIDPGYARAHALVAWTYIAEFMNAWGARPEDSLDEARKFALAAVDIDDREPFGYAVLGWVYMCLKDIERGLEEQKRAIADNPGSAHYRSLYAFTLAYAGQSDKAILELEKAMALNPRFPDMYLVHYGRALFNLRRYDEAIRPLARIRTTQPGNANAVALAAACYAALGRLDEAQAAVDEVRRASPNYTLDYARRFVPFSVKEELDHFLGNLELAGLSN